MPEPFSILKELTFTKEEWEKSLYAKDLDYWISQGSPILWIKEYQDHRATAYSDIGYGKLKLIVDGEVNISSSENAVVNKDYVLLSSYFGDDYQGKIFKQIN